MSAVKWLAAMALVCVGCETAVPTPVAQAGSSLGKPPCVDYRSLREFMPRDLAGFTLARDEGSTGKYGDVLVSEAQRVFTRSDGRQVAIRIVDTTLGKKIGRAIVKAVDADSDREQADPTAPIRWGETLGFVQYDPEESKAEANLWVGRRYVIALTTTGFSGTAELRRVAKEIDLEGLARLR